MDFVFEYFLVKELCFKQISKNFRYALSRQCYTILFRVRNCNVKWNDSQEVSSVKYCFEAAKLENMTDIYYIPKQRII